MRLLIRSRPLVVAVGPVPASVLVSSASGGSGQYTITWLAPTTKEDGSALAGASITTYTVRRYNTSGTLLATTDAGNVLTLTPTSISAGDYDITVACSTAYGEGAESFLYRVTVT